MQVKYLCFFSYRSLAEPLALALILEVSAYPKPGNVHRLRERPGLRYEAFLATGVFSLKYFERGLKRGYRGVGRLVVGDLVYGLVKEVVERLRSTNTCLGSSLLLSLISVSLGRLRALGEGLGELSKISWDVLESTTPWDTVYYYKAIRVASPSYLKPEDDTGDYVNVWDPRYKKHLVERGHRLVDVLRYSSRIDVVAREALSGFKEGFAAERFLRERLSIHGDFNRGVVETYLYLLSRNTDTIVYLKHGARVASEVSERARKALEAILREGGKWRIHAWKLDKELSARSINPGSVADLTAETIALYLLRNVLEGRTLLDLSQ